MATAVLNVKIDETLKEKLRHYAEANNENLSITTEKLLLIAFEAAEEAGVSASDMTVSIRKNPWMSRLLLKKSKHYADYSRRKNETTTLNRQ